MRAKDFIAEISAERLERYLAHADKHVSNRMDRMSQARQRLSKSYEIYHADRPAGSAQIVDRFEADTPEQARQYYEKFIQNYDSDVDFDLRLRKGTGIMEYAQVKRQQENRDGIDLEARSNDKNVSIYAYADGRELAHVHFDIQPYVSDVERKRIIVPYDLEVNDRYRGQGIAKIMYDYAKELGYEVQRSYEQTDAGAHFWDKNRPGQKVWESARLPRSVEDFLYDLMPDDVGVEEIGPYRIHYEGFTDDCQSSGDYCDNPEAVYQQVFADHIAREGGRKPVEQNFTGDEDYPILYSVFRIPRQVKEIARIPQGDFGDEDTLTAPKYAVKKNPLPGGSKFTYAVGKPDAEELEIMIFDGDTLAAELDLFDTRDVTGAWRVSTVAVNPQYRGQGLGKALYGIALSVLKLTLEAGDTQTKHGQQMWLMLNSIPGVEVVGYNMERTSKYKPNPNDKIISQDDNWTRYTFPVKPGTRGMRSARHGTGVYTSQASMLARWTGR